MEKQWDNQDIKMAEREGSPGVRGLLTQKVLPEIRDFLLEPIRVSQAMTERLTYIPPDFQADWQNLSIAWRFMWRLRDYLVGYLPIEMPVMGALGLAIDGNIRGALLVGGFNWVFGAAFIRLTGIRRVR